MGNVRVHAAPAPAANRRTESPQRLRLASEVALDLKEPSDVVALPGGAFLVVGDRSDRALLLRPDGSSAKVKLPGLKDGKSGLEAVAYDPRKKQLLVVSEESGRLLRYDLDAKKGTARLLAEEKTGISGKDNKGVEGMAFLPGEASPTGRPQLLLAKEGKPRSLALMAPDGSGKATRVEVDQALLDACADFSGLAVDPVTGHLFVASQESAVVAEVRLVRRKDKVVAELVQALPLRDQKGRSLPRVEGLAFDVRGDLHVLLEDARTLVRFARG